MTGDLELECALITNKEYGTSGSETGVTKTLQVEGLYVLFVYLTLLSLIFTFDYN
jgi:hypothetical protein